MSVLQLAILEKSGDVAAAPIDEVAALSWEVSADHICELIEGSLFEFHCFRTQSFPPYGFDYVNARPKLTRLAVYSKERNPMPVLRVGSLRLTLSLNERCLVWVRRLVFSGAMFARRSANEGELFPNLDDQ